QRRLPAENASDVIPPRDAAGRCRSASSAARTILGVEPSDLDGTDLFDRVHDDDRETAHSRLAAFAAGRDDSVALVYRWRRPAGDYAWIENVVRAVRDPDTGALTGVEGSARDITAPKAREGELSHPAPHDPPTGAPHPPSLR